MRPNLEYAIAVWDPYRQEQIDSNEAVQRRAANFHHLKITVSRLLEIFDRCNLFYFLILSTSFICIYLTVFAKTCLDITLRMSHWQVEI